MKAKTMALAALLLGLGSFARADRIAVVANPVAMPLGLGADLCYRVSDRFAVRLGGGVPVSGSAENVGIGDVKYDMTVKLGGLNAFADWYPFAGNFRLSGGVVTVRSPWTLTSTHVSRYTINGTSYAAADVGTLAGTMKAGNTVAPAILIGWGNPVRRGKHLGLVVDLGVAYVGSQRLELTADGPLASDIAFRRDLTAEAARHSSSHTVWPILKLGLSYQF